MVDKLNPAVRGAVGRMDQARAAGDIGEPFYARHEDYDTIRAELMRLAAENARLLATVKFRSEAAEAAHGNWQAEFERAERAESELAALKQRVDGYAVTLADKSHPSGLRYVMAYNERETADVLLKNDQHNNGLAVRAFRLLDDGEGA